MRGARSLRSMSLDSLHRMDGFWPSVVRGRCCGVALHVLITIFTGPFHTFLDHGHLLRTRLAHHSTTTATMVSSIEHGKLWFPAAHTNSHFIIGYPQFPRRCGHRSDIFARREFVRGGWRDGRSRMRIVGVKTIGKRCGEVVNKWGRWLLLRWMRSNRNGTGNRRVVGAWRRDNVDWYRWRWIRIRAGCRRDRCLRWHALTDGIQKLISTTTGISST